MLPEFTPRLQLETLFVLDDAGRICSTREPAPMPGPALAIIRDHDSCAWAVGADVRPELALELAALARTEAGAKQLNDPPRHADEYVAMVGGTIHSGPVFTFPPSLEDSGSVSLITNVAELQQCFRGWTAEEIPERSPIVGIVVGGHPVSVCFCARRSDIAAEAGVETATEYRGRGFAARVTAAWAALIRDSGRLPLYSTSWDNAGSLAVARKLRLSACGSDWSLARVE